MDSIKETVIIFSLMKLIPPEVLFLLLFVGTKKRVFFSPTRSHEVFQSCSLVVGTPKSKNLVSAR